ncbi:MAG: kelch repeat-containing protein [Pyrinomonadaceae bacterium]
MRSTIRLCCALAALLTCITICSLGEARAQGVWSSPLAPMPTGRFYTDGATLNGKLYVVGGEAQSTGTPINSLEAYDPATNIWATLAPMTTPRELMAVVAAGGKLYVFGGRNNVNGTLGTMEIYNPATNTWSAGAPMPTPRWSVAGAEIGGKIYAVTGFPTTGNDTNITEVYDIAANTWSTAAPAPSVRRGATVGAVNGKLYVAGGYHNGHTNVLEVYDPALNSWATLNSMPTARWEPSSGVLNGKFYVFCGEAGANKVEVYTPSTNTWATLASDPTTRNGGSAGGFIGNKFYITGADSSTGKVTESFVPPGSLSAGQLIISEFRLYGPTGSNDEYVELYNNTDSPLTAISPDGSSGLSVATALNQATSTTLFVIPNGTVIPARGHFLGVNSAGYSLAAYAAGNVTYTADTPPNVGLALFNTSNTANFSAATRLDAVGSTLETNTLYKEGAGYAPLTFITNRQHAFLRDLSGGRPKDTQDNAADFVYVNTDGSNDGAGAKLGAPGPENLASPIDRTAALALPLLDTTQSASASPNRERDTTSDPANNSTFGTMTIRKRVVNNTGAPVTRLRFRVVIITGSPVQGSNDADLRVRSASDTTAGGINDAATCSPSGTPCTVTVRGLTLESPSATNNGGLNSSLVLSAVTTTPESFEDGGIGIGSSGDDTRGGDSTALDGSPPSDSEDGGVLLGPPVDFDSGTLDAPLANGAALNVQFLFGVQKTGHYRFYVLVEALP